jgi:hypothetical protein
MNAQTLSFFQKGIFGYRFAQKFISQNNKIINDIALRNSNRFVLMCYQIEQGLRIVSTNSWCHKGLVSRQF